MTALIENHCRFLWIHRVWWCGIIWGPISGRRCDLRILLFNFQTKKVRVQSMSAACHRGVSVLRAAIIHIVGAVILRCGKNIACWEKFGPQLQGLHICLWNLVTPAVFTIHKLLIDLYHIWRSWDSSSSAGRVRYPQGLPFSLLPRVDNICIHIIPCFVVT